jgi:integrase
MYRARYRDPAGVEHARHFARKVDAQRWLDAESADVVSGRWVDPAKRKTTVDQWCEQWLAGHGSRRPSSQRNAAAHLAKIRAEFGGYPLSAVQPSMIRAWLARLRAEGLSVAYVFVLHARLSQVFTDAVLDGLVGANPCSRRTSPGTARQRPYLATTEQVWGLHDEVGEPYRVAVLLGAFAGLRIAEACGLRVADVDFPRRELTPAVQWPAQPLKTAMSRTTVPIADTLVAAISAQVGRWPAPGQTVLTDADGGGQLNPHKLGREIRRARTHVAGLPAGFRFHDLRHYYASLLISSGADVKIVQHRMRHTSAKTTLDTYGHLWPDTDESTRKAVERVLSAKLADSADSVRTGADQ